MFYPPCSNSSGLPLLLARGNLKIRFQISILQVAKSCISVNFKHNDVLAGTQACVFVRIQAAFSLRPIVILLDI
jgi:hypothetical protein